MEKLEYVGYTKPLAETNFFCYVCLKIGGVYEVLDILGGEVACDLN